MATAKLFRNRRRHAVRLPDEFRFEGTEVSIRRVGDAVILEPFRTRARAWPEGYWERWGNASRALDVIAAPIAPGGEATRPIP